MTDLSEFLLARITEDEEAWRGGLGLATRPDFSKLSRHMLADCDAKRRIVALHSDLDSGDYCRVDDEPDPCPTLRLLALPYADHEMFQDEWRP